MDAIRFYLQNSLDLIDFKPTFLYSQIGKKLPKKPQRIFVGSMSEIYYWEKFWIEGVIKKIRLYPQHTFIFLTKHPEVYRRYVFPKNCWLGVTITNNKMLYSMEDVFTYQKRIKFISIEPILEHIDIRFIDYLDIDLIIVGAETGNRKGRIVPKKEWIEAIINYCREINIPVYLKDSLKGIYPGEVKEFPEKETMNKLFDKKRKREEKRCKKEV